MFACVRQGRRWGVFCSVFVVKYMSEDTVPGDVEVNVGKKQTLDNICHISTFAFSEMLKC